MLLRSAAVGLGLGMARGPGVLRSPAPLFAAAARSVSSSAPHLRHFVPSPSIAKPTRSNVLSELRKLSVTRTGASGVAKVAGRVGTSGAVRGFGTSSGLLQRLGRIRPRRIEIPIQGAAEAGGLPEPSVLIPILFSIVFTFLAFFLAALYTNADTSYYMSNVKSYSLFTPSNRDIRQAKKLHRAAQAQQALNSLPKTLSWLPNFLLVPIVRTYVVFEEWRINSPGARVAPASLIAIMVPVFLAWQIRSWQPFMRKWFTHYPVVFRGGEARSCITMITSVFSHKDLWHFAFNSIALYSFGTAAYAYLAQPGTLSLPTSTDTPQFFAFFVVAGLAASLGSHLFTNLVRLPRLMRALLSPARLSSPQALAAHNAILPSLGASGAVYAMLSMVALSHPNSYVSIIFIPFIKIPIGLGVAGMVLLDVVGILRGWKTFDHVAHFCGAMFGIVYYWIGKDCYAWLRDKLGSPKRTWR